MEQLKFSGESTLEQFIIRNIIIIISAGKRFDEKYKIFQSVKQQHSVKVIWGAMFKE